MTTLTATPAHSAPHPVGRRLWNVMRLHAANPFTILLTPLMVLGLVLLANIVIWWVVAVLTSGDTQAVSSVSRGMQYGGASMWTFVYMMVVAIQAMNLTFQSALGFGSTRHDFALGTALTFVVLSVFYALVYAALAAIEIATNGWGLGGSMFSGFYLGPDDPWGLRLFNTFAAFMFFFLIGSLFGAIYVRFRTQGLVLFFAVLTLALIGATVLFTLTGSWPAVGRFFVTLGFAGSYALALGVGLVAGVAGYLVLRRATARS